MVELSDEQQKALDSRSGEPLQLVDPRTSQTYVLILRSDYERIQRLLEDTELEKINVRLLMDEAMREDDENDPLLDSYQKE